MSSLALCCTCPSSSLLGPLQSCKAKEAGGKEMPAPPGIQLGEPSLAQDNLREEGSSELLLPYLSNGAPA